MIEIVTKKRITAKCVACGFGIYVEDEPSKLRIRDVIDGFVTEYGWHEDKGIFICPECWDEGERYYKGGDANAR